MTFLLNIACAARTSTQFMMLSPCFYKWLQMPWRTLPASLHVPVRKNSKSQPKRHAVGRELNQYPLTCTPLSTACVIDIVRMSIPDSHTQNGEDAHNRDAWVCKQQMLAKIIGDPMDWTPNEGRRLAQSRRTVAFGPLEISQTKLQSLKSYSYLKVVSSLGMIQGRYWRRFMASLKPRSCAGIQDRTSL